jgi:hypothetical protein
MTMTNRLAIALLPFALALGCGDDNTTTPDATPTVDHMAADTTPTPDAPGFPTAPTLGSQIDRMGRPAVNTALTDPFWDNDPANVATTLETHHMKQDTYNHASDNSMWLASFRAQIKTNLAIIDGLDGNCGNGIAADYPPGGGTPRYQTLAGILSDDELQVNTANGTCALFLGVELKVLGVDNNDCGGRTPTENVIDPVYSALATGQATGVSNGITSDADGNANNTTFPFLGAPN